MVEKIFVALDLPTDEIVETGRSFLEGLEGEYGNEIKKKFGVKINDYALRKDFSKYRVFKDMGYEIFGDLKISHGCNRGYKIVKEVISDLPLDYITVSASLMKKNLRCYVEKGKEDGIKVIGFTIHTKIPEDEAKTLYGKTVSQVIYELGKISEESGCDAITTDVKALEESKGLRNLKIKKLIPGVRINPSDKDYQARVSPMGKVKELKDYIHYVVMSERYLNDRDAIERFIDLIM